MYFFMFWSLTSAACTAVSDSRVWCDVLAYRLAPFLDDVQSLSSGPSPDALARAQTPYLHAKVVRVHAATWMALQAHVLWGAAGLTRGEVLPFNKALAHAALNPPEGHINQLEALRHYLLQVENQLWGVLDRGWTGVPQSTSRLC